MTFTTNKKNAPHLLAESGAWEPGFQILKVVVMTFTPVTLLPSLHYPCQRILKCAELRTQRVQDVFASVVKIENPAGMIMFYTG
jgi:hypothetical protein